MDKLPFEIDIRVSGCGTISAPQLSPAERAEIAARAAELDGTDDGRRLVRLLAEIDRLGRLVTPLEPDDLK